MRKKTTKEKILYLLGYKYIINKRTEEIHSLENEKSNCKIDLIVNKKYITKKAVDKLLEDSEFLMNDYNGCRWCMKKFDNG